MPSLNSYVESIPLLNYSKYPRMISGSLGESQAKVTPLLRFFFEGFPFVPNFPILMFLFNFKKFVYVIYSVYPHSVEIYL